MKSFLQLILESQASDQAHKMGLKSVGWGKWKDNSDKVTHQTKDGKLVKIVNKTKTSKQKNTTINSDNLKLSNFYNAINNWKNLSDDQKDSLDKIIYKNVEWFDAVDGWFDAGANAGYPGDSNYLRTSRVLFKHGYGIGKLLGSGGMGSAFEIKNGKVLKVTIDDSEAKAMNIVKNYPHPNIVKVNRVFKVKGNNRYFIDQEKLLPIPKEFKFGKAETLEIFYSFASQKLKKMNVKDAIKKTQEDFKEYDENHIKKEKWFNSNKEAQKLILDTLKATKHLQQLGINFQDFHMGNILRDKNGNYKLIDLGLSVGPGLKKSNIKQIREKNNTIK